jgi:hypothetical protein
MTQNLSRYPSFVIFGAIKTGPLDVGLILAFESSKVLIEPVLKCARTSLHRLPLYDISPE